MRKVKDVLRLKFDAGLSHRDISKCLSIGPATVSEVLSRFTASDLSWPLPDAYSDVQLEGKLYPSVISKSKKRPLDGNTIRLELRRKGMTKLLLWQEYCEEEAATLNTASTQSDY